MWSVHQMGQWSSRESPTFHVWWDILRIYYCYANNISLSLLSQSASLSLSLSKVLLALDFFKRPWLPTNTIHSTLTNLQLFFCCQSSSKHFVYSSEMTVSLSHIYDGPLSLPQIDILRRNSSLINSPHEVGIMKN